MPLILHIDTSCELASVALSVDKTILAFDSNENFQDHASWIHLAIEGLTKKAGRSLSELSAVSVTIGPGSYTGLRVGLATAKGICYALKKPLITIPTLELVAAKAKESTAHVTDILYCPMIDARRMEVFTSFYDSSLTEIGKARAIILDETSFLEELKDQSIFFCGNGAAKFKQLCQHPQAQFFEEKASAENMMSLAIHRYRTNDFASLAYSVPLYLKEFQSNSTFRS